MERSKSSHEKLNQTLTFYDLSGEALPVQLLAFEQTRRENRLAECNLLIEVSPEVYAQIDNSALFHLSPEVRGPNFSSGFRPDKAVELELGLRATLFGELENLAPAQIEAHLVKLSADQNASLLQTENWYALNVRQANGPVKLGYQTSWTEADSPVYGDFQKTAESLFEDVTDFLQDDGWPLTLIADATSVQTLYEGISATWQCFAEVNEEKGHFAFYSIAPVTVGESDRDRVSEYLTRANYGLLLGNFELDYTDGEVRFRTSILIDNSKSQALSPNIIKHLVHSNVFAMDNYLPGLMRLIDHKLTPQEAIEKVETATGTIEIDPT